MNEADNDDACLVAALDAHVVNVFPCRLEVGVPAPCGQCKDHIFPIERCKREESITLKDLSLSS